MAYRLTMPLKHGDKYYLQNVYTGHYLYGTEGRTALNTGSVKHDNAFYHVSPNFISGK